MQNSEAVQAWIQGKMATFKILVLISKTEIRSREFSFSSRSLRKKIINLDLVSMLEIGGDFFSDSSRSLRLSVRNPQSRLDVRDWIGETLILVSRMKNWLSVTYGWEPEWGVLVARSCPPDLEEMHWLVLAGLNMSHTFTVYTNITVFPRGIEADILICGFLHKMRLPES